MDWMLSEAKNKLSEVINLALTKGPQRITRHGKEAVFVVSEREYKAGNTNPEGKQDFLEFLMSGPGFEGLDLTRDKSPTRDVDLFTDE